jgi:hypothetical protein
MPQLSLLGKPTVTDSALHRIKCASSLNICPPALLEPSSEFPAEERRGGVQYLAWLLQAAGVGSLNWVTLQWAKPLRSNTTPTFSFVASGPSG